MGSMDTDRVMICRAVKERQIYPGLIQKGQAAVE